MRIASYNVNGINGRLANLLGWLQEAAPDIVCLQELKAPDEKFPAAALRAAGYGAVWHGQKSWNGDIEAAIGGLLVGCLYLPNGNPAPGPKFDYKLHLFERLTGYSQSLLDSGAPAPISRGNRKFESVSLQRRVRCEPDFLALSKNC